jgi:hypothetical protein
LRHAAGRQPNAVTPGPLPCGRGKALVLDRVVDDARKQLAAARDRDGNRVTGKTVVAPTSVIN